MFLEKRVYQGSSGKVYPYPVIKKTYDEKQDREYQAVYTKTVMLEEGDKTEYTLPVSDGGFYEEAVRTLCRFHGQEAIQSSGTILGNERSQ